MAGESDIAKLGFGVETSQLVKAQQELRKLPAATKVAETATQKLEKSLEKTLAGVNASLEKLQVETTRNVSALGKVVSAAAPAAGALAKVENGATGAAGSVSRLRATWDSLLSSMARTPVAGDAGFIGPIQLANKEVKNMQFNTGNLVAQFNDIGVTAAMGMSPMMIALQQGTQLMQAFVGMKPREVMRGVGSAIAGVFSATSLLTIGIVALTAAFAQWVVGLFTAEEKAKDIKDIMGELKQSSQEFIELQKTYTFEGLAKMKEDFQGMNMEMLVLLERQRAFAENEAWNKTKEAASAVKTEIGDLIVQADAVNGISQNIDNLNGIVNSFTLSQMKLELADATTLLESYAADIGLTKDEAIELANSLGNISKAATYQEMIGQWNKIEKLIAKSSLNGSELQKRILEAWAETQKLANAAPKAGWLNAAKAGVQPVTDSLIKSWNEAQRLSASAPSSAWMNPALTGVNILIGALSKAVNLTSQLGQTKGNLDWAKAGNGFLLSGDELLGMPEPKKTGGSKGGGSGGADKVLSDLEKINEQISKMSEPFDQAKGAVDALYSAFENGIISNDQYSATLGKIETAFLAAGGTAEQFALILEGVGEKTESLEKKLKDLGESSLKSLGDEFINLAVDGKANFADLAKSIIKDLLRIAWQALIIKPLMAWLGFKDGGSFSGGGVNVVPNANGNAFDKGVTAFASGGNFTNSIVNKATPFAFGGGSQLGVMGEAGPEAIMPLKRGADGSLGVQMHGAGAARSGGDNGTLRVYVTAEEGEMFRPIVRAEAEGVAATVMQQGAEQMDQGLPERVLNILADERAR